MAEKSAEKKNLFVKFFKSLKTEAKKIVWPTKEQTAKQTAAVVIISIIMCGLIRLIDVLAQQLVGLVQNIGA